MEWSVEDYNNRRHKVHNIFSLNEMSAGTYTYDYRSKHNRGRSNCQMFYSQCARINCIQGDSTTQCHTGGIPFF